MNNTVKQIIVTSLQDHLNIIELIEYTPKHIHVGQEVAFKYQDKYINGIVIEKGTSSTIEVLSR